MAVNHAYYQKIILDGITEDYDGNPVQSDRAKAKILTDRFESEFKYDIQRYGRQKAMENWLSGLAIDIPYSYNDILKIAKNGGSLPENATEKQEDKIVNNYWSFMAKETLKLIDKYNK